LIVMKYALQRMQHNDATLLIFFYDG